MCCLEVAGECPAGQFFLPSVLPVGSLGRLFDAKGRGLWRRRHRRSVAIDPAPSRRSADPLTIYRSTSPLLLDRSISSTWRRDCAPPSRLPIPKKNVVCDASSLTIPASAPRPQSNTRRSSRTFRPSPSFANAPATCTAARSSRKWSSRVRATFPRPREALGPLTASLVSNKKQTYSATKADDASARLTTIHPT